MLGNIDKKNRVEYKIPRKKKKMKIAILGGSFNPPHYGHLALADAALSAFDYERVILIPAYESPFKIGAEGADAEDRLDMLISSITAYQRLTVDDCEIRRKGVSYTIDTIADIQKRYCPDGKIGLIIGDDLAADFPQWRNAGEILEKTDIMVAQRLFPENARKKFSFPHKTLNNEIMAVSSAEVRERIARNKNWRYLVPDGARRVIEERNLYKKEKKTAPFISDIFRMEKEVRALVSMGRFLHSRNVALLCYDLCGFFGLDPEKGYLAGIVHDICKSFPDEELIKLAKKDGEKISQQERKKISLLHARAGAVLLKERFALFDADILEAVRCHTTGRENMGNLAKIVFIADKAEVSRTDVNPAIREMIRRPPSNLDELFAAVLGESVSYLRSNEKEIFDETLRLLAENKRFFN
jgi:nicotinate-nucleotide adenylyltransferase